MRSGIQSLVEEEARREKSNLNDVKWNLFRRTNSPRRASVSRESFSAPSASGQKQNRKSIQHVESLVVDLERNKCVEKHDRRKSRAASMAVLFISTAMSPLKVIPAAKATRKYQSAKDRFNSVINSSPVRFFMTLVTLYSLYSMNIRELALRKTYDSALEVCSSIVFFLFLVEVIAKCFCQQGYLQLPDRKKFDTSQCSLENENFVLRSIKLISTAINIGSFYFYLDLISTLSMIFELPWIIPSSVYQIVRYKSVNSWTSVEEGTNPTSLFNVARMFRILRIVKLYKYFSENKSIKSSGLVIPDSGEVELKNIQSDSRVGDEMSDRTTRKVIIGVFIMLFVLPFFQMRKCTYFCDLQLEIIYKQWISWINADDIMKPLSLKKWRFSENHLFKTCDCVSLKYSTSLNVAEFSVSDSHLGNSLSTLRAVEVESIILSEKEMNSFSIRAEFDISSRVRKIAMLDIFLSTFVIFLLGLGNISFSRDVNTLVIVPIEKMVRLVREISINPLGKDYTSSPEHTSVGEGGAFETVLLLRTISKIASLMRVGFGEAGAEIIGRNLNMASAGKGGAGGIYATSMNLMGGGRKIQSIFAFCDIRNFTDTTECLQEEVMLFVNRIAHVLHSIVVQCGGAANKNIGDAFLLTWKVDPVKIKSGDPSAYGFVADRALFSLLKTFVEIISNHDFICNFAPSSLAALYDRLPGYRCRIGCGLHFGWAIEGAIGTDKKIDASYISPHVNWSECLEAWTKEYGVPLLMSEPFFRLLSPNASKLCRQIDRIKKNLLDDVISIYTYDANLDIDFRKEKVEQFSRAKEDAPLHRNPADKTQPIQQSTRTSRRENAKSSRIIVSVEQPEIILSDFSVDVWNDDTDMMLLRMHFDDECRSTWDEGLDCFLGGNWASAKDKFKHVLDRLDGNDGPSKFLLKYIEEQDSVCPFDWSGYRDLCARNDDSE